MASIRAFARTARQFTVPACQIRPTTTTTATTTTTTIAPGFAWQARPYAASGQAAPAAETEPVFQELESDSSLFTPPLPEDVKLLTPRERATKRTNQLPGSRYQYHPPKYDRGPLHPVQSPPSSDPTARDFVPGPFYAPRLRQTYQSTIAADLMTLAYTHTPPGEKPPPSSSGPVDRLRRWDDSSPYHKNRPLRPPRGGESILRPLERPITFRNVPDLRAITLATFVPQAAREPDRLVVARAVLQAVTGVVPETTKVKHNVAHWGIIKGQKAGCKVTLYGPEAYELLDKCVHLVFPRIKDWPGVKGTTGDSAGNLAWGFTSENMALFPEIEANYSMYPAKLIPGCRVFVETTAKSDRHARLLLGAFGVPFYGKLRD
ncbi:50S ribosomal subunit [Niveomyces insectorum RCEF 264]|uniref:50S ribosomal subunit n=1 Tax=Niveomyces insectorum RCEF 264 TaxID=1081102 RepID=A0A167ULX0_9HYPO|nr:50S ribosomal subunit [Niveomyces insectorum RCEF 264]